MLICLGATAATAVLGPRVRVTRDRGRIVTSPFAERTRSNTPQQALTLLNDVTYVEAARNFAARIIKECNGDTPTRITWAFRTALSRDPRPEEIPILVALLEKRHRATSCPADRPDDDPRLPVLHSNDQ